MGSRSLGKTTKSFPQPLTKNHPRPLQKVGGEIWLNSYVFFEEEITCKVLMKVSLFGGNCKIIPPASAPAAFRGFAADRFFFTET